MSTDARQQPPALDPEIHLHVCGTCGSELVHPLGWERVGKRFWQIELRCPECWWEGTGVFDDTVAERFEEQLDLATDSLLSDLGTLATANMHDFAERFVAALRAGQLLPEDF